MTFDNSQIKNSTTAQDIHIPEPSSPTRSPHILPDTTEEEDDIDASPLHFHVGENAKLLAKPRPSRSRSHSRSRDPSPMTCRTPSNSGRSRSNSNASSGYVSADDIHVDPDILLDKMGHEDLEQPKHLDIHSLRASLPIVNERMSEESLDDCHAFSDLKDVIRQISRDGGPLFLSTGSGGASNTGLSSRSSENSLSREGSMAGGSVLGDGGHLLETLEEFEEEDEQEEEEEEQEGVDKNNGNQDESSKNVQDESSDRQHDIDANSPTEKKKRFGFFKKKKAKAVTTDTDANKDKDSK
mmetsp:Transcript_7844/g.14784  ORF Transcript_7844/g.14784 Transcript_7844/m.14784 type:complete len:297 (-) Transcript_7844:40-930(-)